MSAVLAANNILIAASEVDHRLLECLANCRTTVVRTMEEARRALREQLFKLIVVDLNFEGIGVLDLLPHVRSLGRLDGVPVLCIRAGPDPASMAAALDRVVRLCRMLGAELGIHTESGSRPQHALLDAPEARPQPPLCILIIDHDVDAAHRLGELLEQLGHEVDFAYGATAGMDAARRLRPDICFVRSANAHWDGYGLAQGLRREAHRGKLFLVALAAAQKTQSPRPRHAGFDAHLVAPANRESIATVLKAYRTPESH